MPARIAWRDCGPQVEWTLMGKERLLDPLFEQTMQRQMTKPFHQLFRRQTSMEEMAAWTDAHCGARLAGIVFHMSRCGATLIGHQLAAMERNIVASEPGPMEYVLRAQIHVPDLPRALHLRWLRAMAAALGQPRNGEKAFYLRTCCWHIHQFDLLREAFPETPWIFLYRDPVQVMASLTRIPAAWTAPSILHPSRLQLEKTDWAPTELDVYCACALANFCQSGLKAAQLGGGGQLVNSSELPEAMYHRLLPHFGLREEDVPAMRQAAQQNTEPATMATARDGGAKQAEASDRLRAVVAQHLMPVYVKLEAARRGQIEAAEAALRD